MRYNARRNYLHPVLRPFSDDYPGGNLRTQITRSEVTGGVLNVAMAFEVSEPSILEQVRSGHAICVAMFYCSATLHREMLYAGLGSLEVSASISTDILRGDVELHPAIVANNSIDHSTETAHTEYSSTLVSISRWHPLAVDQTWRFQVNPNVRPTKGIFNLENDNDLPNGFFDIKTDVAARYVNITANSATMSKFKALSNNESRTVPTIYMSALVTALAESRAVDADDSDVPSDGWVNCIKNNMNRLNINITEEEGTHTLLKAAQLLLNNPFDVFLTVASQADAYGEEEDES